MMKSTKIAHFATALAGGLVLLFALSAVPGDSYACHREAPHGKQTDCGGGASLVFTAELTTGAFVFGPVDVTPNRKETALRSNTDLNFDIAFSPAPATWDQVFNTCGELLDPDSVDDFFVGEDNWSIQKSEETGEVRVIFSHIELQGAEVVVQLIGGVFDPPFLPGLGETRTYTLADGAIFGRTLKGTHPRMGCQPPGGGGFDIFDLLSVSELVITAAAGD